MKRQSTVWEKTLANPIPDKGLYGEYIKNSQISLRINNQGVPVVAQQKQI